MGQDHREVLKTLLSQFYDVSTVDSSNVFIAIDKRASQVSKSTSSPSSTSVRTSVHAQLFLTPQTKLTRSTTTETIHKTEEARRSFESTKDIKADMKKTQRVEKTGSFETSSENRNSRASVDSEEQETLQEAPLIHSPQLT